jgi:hypothetical protein
MVLTPLKPGANESIIEDCFAQEIKNLNLGGKTFNPDNNSDSSRYFHKHILSEHLRANAAKVDFTGVVELLDRITAAIEAHQTQQAFALAQAASVVNPSL